MLILIINNLNLGFMEKGFNCALCHYYNITSSNDIECSAGHRMWKDWSDS